VIAAEDVRLRAFAIADTDAVVAVYRDAVRTLGPQAYAPREVAVWACHPEDPVAFGQQLMTGVTLLAELDGAVAAFAQLQPADHVHYLYCRGDVARRGLGSRLLLALEQRAREAGTLRLTTDASRLGRPFFARHGFAVERTEWVERGGATFERFRMVKSLG